MHISSIQCLIIYIVDSLAAETGRFTLFHVAPPTAGIYTPVSRTARYIK